MVQPTQTYAPPQGPPPSSSSADAPPPFHDWETAVPDTSLLPPPPTISYEASPVANASLEAADRAHAWTDANRLWPPRELDEHDRQALRIQYSSVIKPQELLGTIKPDKDKAGLWHVSTTRRCDDACLLSTVPLYSALGSRPLRLGDRHTAYYEVRVGKLDTANAGIALGFVAPPYPSWRLPGWERASIGVHGDDGRRFVNDTWGGRDFTDAFRPGDVVGLGMEFTVASDRLPSYSKKDAGPLPLDVKVFFTRNGKKAGEWDIHEEVDADMEQPGGVAGFEGLHDLHAAVGVYGAVECTIVFGRHRWLYHPS